MIDLIRHKLGTIPETAIDNDRFKSEAQIKAACSKEQAAWLDKMKERVKAMKPKNNPSQ